MPARFETDRHVAQGIDTTTRQDDGRPCHAEQAGSHPARPIPRRYCAGETGDLQPGCDAGGCEPTCGGWAGQAASGATPRARRRGCGPRPEAALSRSSLAGPARGHARSIRDHAEHTRRPAADQRSRGAAVAARGLRQRVLPFRTDPLEGVVVIARHRYETEQQSGDGKSGTVWRPGRTDRHDGAEAARPRQHSPGREIVSGSGQEA